MPVSLTAAWEDKVERRDVREAASLQLDATRPSSVHGLQWRLQSKTGQELFVAQEGEFVALEAPHTHSPQRDVSVGCQTARMNPWSGLHALQATSGHAWLNVFNSNMADTNRDAPSVCERGRTKCASTSECRNLKFLKCPWLLLMLV